MASQKDKLRLVPALLLGVALSVGLLACTRTSVQTGASGRFEAEHALAQDEVVLLGKNAGGGFSSTNHVDFGAWLKDGLPRYENVAARSVPGGWDVGVIDGKRTATVKIARNSVMVEIEGKTEPVEIVTVQSSGGDPELAADASRSVVRFLLTSPRFHAGKAKRVEPVSPVWDHPPKFQWVQKPRSTAGKNGEQ